jgi:hypothetical protein
MKHDQPLWIQVLYALFLCGGISYYLFRAWQRGSIATPLPNNRSRTGGWFRDDNPGVFWFLFIVYGIFDLFIILLVAYRVYEKLQSEA